MEFNLSNRQLRESFDSGQEMKLDEDCCPHDVATLLKEYFRDLPDPLLTRELYDAFVQTQSGLDDLMDSFGAHPEH